MIAQGGMTAAQVAYMGDDLVDLPVLRRVGFSATVSDAHDEVLKAVDFVSANAGGRGAVREVCEIIIRARGKWNELTARYRE